MHSPQRGSLPLFNFIPYEIVNHQWFSKYHSETPTKKATKNVTFVVGVPEWIRTTDLPLRRRLLYPAELPGLVKQNQHVTLHKALFFADSRPPFIC
jgi:hypothetical protein